MENFGTSANPLTSQVREAQMTATQIVNQEHKKSRFKKFFILFVILGLTGVGVYLLIQGNSVSEDSSVSLASSTPVGTVAVSTPAPTSTPSAKTDKSEISIKILNGTGTAGDAKFLQTKMESAGFKKFEVGNASSQTAESTSVIFADDIDESITKEITALLEASFTDVNTKTSTVLTTDVEITTGPKKGVLASPSSTPTPKATATATPTSSPN